MNTDNQFVRNYPNKNNIESLLDEIACQKFPEENLFQRKAPA